MITLTKTTLKLGLEKPVKILHITDVHLTYANENDTLEHHELMKQRFNVFYKPERQTPKEYFEQSIELAKKENALLVCTGDAIDINTKGNVEAFWKIVKDTDMMFSPGGHEHQRVCRRTMEEPYPYWETVRKEVEKNFAPFNLAFESRIINGLNVITADNSLDYFSKETLTAFKKELEKGLPIIVFCHDPLWDPRLLKKEPYHPNVRLTQEDYATSHEMIDLILHHPLVVTTFAGHGHADYEEIIDGKTHYMTEGLFRGVARLIEII